MCILVDVKSVVLSVILLIKMCGKKLKNAKQKVTRKKSSNIHNVHNKLKLLIKLSAFHPFQLQKGGGYITKLQLSKEV